jgi:hypothetical protein
MMKKEKKYETGTGNGLDANLDSMIIHSQVRWSQSKEAMWHELESRMESVDSVPVVRLQWVRYAVAASLILLLGAGAFAMLFTKQIETVLGDHRVVSLPDHSTVEMEPGSQLRYRPLAWFVWRDVHFEGQALFRVVSGSQFRVLSSRGSTTVLGTQFWVDTRQDGYEVTCVSGSVKVAETKHETRVVLRGGQKASLTVEGKLEVTDVIPDGIVPDNRPESLEEKGSDHVKQPVESQEITSPVQPAFKPVLPEKEIREDNHKVSTDNRESVNEVSPPVSAPVDERLMNQIVEDVSQQSTDKGSQQEEVSPVKSPSGKSNDAFKASLRPEQVKILEDASLSREQRRKAFLESLSPALRELLEQQNRDRQRELQSQPKRSDVATPVRQSDREQLKEQVRQGADQDAKQSDVDVKRGEPQNRQGTDKNQKGR